MAVKPEEVRQALQSVKHIIAVASGKGGVGKSTTSVNLALALHQEGYKVGLLDADIYGPSQAMMLGIKEGTRPQVLEGKWFQPVVSYGVCSMTMGYMATENTPMAWRGPMATGALLQLISQTLWGELDFLIIDMPPGTGDIQLTLAQRVPVTGAVIVTTPQDIATLDARKGIEMFRKVEIPVLGVVENMAMHTCSQCGHSEHIFGEGGGLQIAKRYDTELLGSLPLALSIRENTDAGKPSVVADPNGDIARGYRDIAKKTAELAKKQREQANVVKIFTTED